jgi:MFS superfamily sulfate permease-like transporter
MIGEDSGALPDVAPNAAIRSGQPDREHAVLEVVGAPGPDPLDVRLHAPTTDTVIVWVAGPIRRADAPLLTLRVRQQIERALHVILDLSSVTRLDPTVAADLRALESHADSCGCRLHIAGAENPAIAEPLRHLESAHQLTNGPADAVLAVLTARTAGAASAALPFAGRPTPMENAQ